MSSFPLINCSILKKLFFAILYGFLDEALFLTATAGLNMTKMQSIGLEY